VLREQDPETTKGLWAVSESTVWRLSSTLSRYNLLFSGFLPMLFWRGNSATIFSLANFLKKTYCGCVAVGAL
jgi:hypothetical protein